MLQEVISYSITKKLHIYGMNTIHMQSYYRLDKYKIENLAGRTARAPAEALTPSRLAVFL